MSDLLESQTGPYIPRTDNGAREWLNQFASRVALDPLAAGLSVNDSQTLTNLAQAYESAYTLATQNATRTPSTIEQKDIVRNQAVETFRVFAMLVKSNLGVPEQLKRDLGLHVNDTTPSPIPAPVTMPLLAVVSTENGTHEIRYADSETPAARRMPPGAANLQLFRNLTPQPSVNTATLQFVGAFTKQPIRVPYDPIQTGLSATYIGRWANRKGQVGPWGPATTMTVGFGGPVQVQSQAA